MRLKELIKKLQEVEKNHGDVEVFLFIDNQVDDVPMIAEVESANTE